MKYIVSRYNQDIEWLKEYTNDPIIFDRSEIPLANTIPVQNIGSDIYDKFSFIIENYDNLPDVGAYIKANLFKYISKEEFDKVKDNTTFTPLLTMNHKVYEPVCRYNEGIYEEINNGWYLAQHPAKKADELFHLLGIAYKWNLQFAPGSNYILPKETILKHPKELYVKLREYLAYDVYPGEAQIMERGLYHLWK